MFGPGIPILYPTFLLAITIQYTVERLQMAYYYKQPPMYDDKLSNTTINFCYLAFGLQMFFGYWMFNNKQIFGNHVIPLTEASSPNYSDHSIWDPIEINQAFPFLVMGIAFVLFNIGGLIYSLIYKYIGGTTVSNYENLNPFLHYLKQTDRDWIVNEERFKRDKDGYKVLPDRFYKKLKTSSEHLSNPNALNNRNYIQGVATYNILANPYYEEKFQYFHDIVTSDIDSKIFMSDKVRKIINLAYLNNHQIKELDFSNIFMQRFAQKLLKKTGVLQNILKHGIRSDDSKVPNRIASAFGSSEENKMI
jgi:hypothetical protein